MDIRIGDIKAVLERGYKIGLRDSNVSDLSGIAGGTLSRAKNGASHLSANDWLLCKNLVEDCEELQRRAGLLPIVWSNIRVVKTHLEALREERRNPPAPPTELDWELLALVGAPNMTTASIASRLGITVTELSGRMAEARKRFAHSTNQLATLENQTSQNDQPL